MRLLLRLMKRCMTWYRPSCYLKWDEMARLSNGTLDVDTMYVQTCKLLCGPLCSYGVLGSAMR